MTSAGYEPARPKVSVWLYCAETATEARRGAEKHMTEFSESSIANYELNSTHFKDIKGYEFYGERAALIQQGEAEGRNLMAESQLAEHCWGTPDMCLKRLQEISEMLRTEEIVL